MRLKKFTLMAAGAMGMLGILPAAQAIDMTAGDWTFTVNGNINANYVYSMCDDQAAAPGFGGALAGGVVGACNIADPIGDDDVSQVRTGLLPAALVFGVATQQNGWDLSGTFGLYPGIVTNDNGSPNLTPGSNFGLGTTGLDIRQAFLTFGNAEFGTVLMGRNFGLFGFDAIINDMSIPAVGAATNAVGSPANTTLGSIGFGYIYADTLAQINYTTPDFNGFTGTIGVFQTVDSITSATSYGVGESAPGVQGQLKYAYGNGFVSMNAATMNVNGVTNNLTGDVSKENVWGVDINWKHSFGPVGLLLSAYTTEGWGSVALLFDSFSYAGEPRDSSGGLAQVTYTMGKHKFGVNYGISTLDTGAGDTVANLGSSLFESNEKYTLGYYYAFTPNLSFTFEFTDATSQDHAGNEVGSQNFNVGAFFSF